MIGYKICRTIDSGGFADGYCLVTLEIPAQSTVVYPYNTNKLRCDYALVSDIRLINLLAYGNRYTVTRQDGPSLDMARNLFTDYSATQYIRGKIIRADWLDKDPRVRCGHGIGFFRTKREAYKFLSAFNGLFPPTKVVGLIRFLLAPFIGRD